MKTRERRFKIVTVAILVTSFAVGVVYPFVNDLLGLPTEVTIFSDSMQNTIWVYPNDPGFRTFGDGLIYRFGLWSLFLAAPVYLIPPVLHLMPRMVLWVLAILSIPIVFHYSKGLSHKRRFAYVYVISGQIASFASPLFVWHNSYSQLIFPEI